MDNKTKNTVLSKTRLVYGLLNILEYDIDNLKNDVSYGDTVDISRTVDEINDTLDNLIDVIAEIEYALYLKGYTRE